jgi:prolyl-tRNA editing enzyme YbaK/EbsC (Cys-tRNA(Pro) deacylase)
MTLEEKIIGMLDEQKISYEIVEHEPVYTKKVSFAKPEEVSESVGCEVGCVPPFGHFSTLPIYLDPQLAKKDFVYFNPGVHDKSFKVKGWDLRKLCQP